MLKFVMSSKTMTEESTNLGLIFIIVVCVL